MTKIKDEEFPKVRVSQKLRKETEECAKKEEENLSEYIRNAVKQRNERVMVNDTSL